jgi:hypothetical protein
MKPENSWPDPEVFITTDQEFANLRSQSVTSRFSEWGGGRHRPMAFSEQGVAMLSSGVSRERALSLARGWRSCPIAVYPPQAGSRSGKMTCRIVPLCLERSPPEANKRVVSYPKREIVQQAAEQIQFANGERITVASNLNGPKARHPMLYALCPMLFPTGY